MKIWTLSLCLGLGTLLGSGTACKSRTKGDGGDKDDVAVADLPACNKPIRVGPTLIDRGKGRSQKLRYQPAVERNAYFSSSSGPDAGKPMGIRLTLRWSCTTQRCTYTVTESEPSQMPKDMVEQERGIMAGIARMYLGMGGKVLIGRDGDLELDANATLFHVRPNLPESLRLALVPFPVESVAEGARWRVVETEDIEGVKVTTRRDFVLEKMEGASYRVTIEVHEDVEKPPGADASSEPGAGNASVADLLPSAGDVTAVTFGTVTVRSTDPMPVGELRSQITIAQYPPALSWILTLR
jgi:hypothetical protein